MYLRTQRFDESDVDNISMRSNFPSSLRCWSPIYQADKLDRKLVEAFRNILWRFYLTDVSDSPLCTAYQAAFLENIFLLFPMVLIQRRGGHLGAHVAGNRKFLNGTRPTSRKRTG